jgi:predicted ATP-grasp superfamily ATP-dependent carboligase
MGSLSSKMLAQAGVFAPLRIRSDGKYRYKQGDLILNWGNAGGAIWYTGPHVKMINTPDAVALSVGKKGCFQVLQDNGISVPDFSSDPSTATSWIEQGHVVYCRTLTRSTKGKGIIVATNPGELVSAPLYTKGIECKREYRVHVCDGEVIDLVAKAQMSSDNPEYVDPDPYIRNTLGGYIFVRDSVVIPASVREALGELAINAIKAIGLDFGAVDIIRGMDNNIYVLEINTAPGMEGTTYEKYIDALTKLSQKIFGGNQ